MKKNSKPSFWKNCHPRKKLGFYETLIITGQLKKQMGHPGITAWAPMEYWYKEGRQQIFSCRNWWL